MQIVTHVDDAEELVPFLQGLGRDHRKFGALAAHYGAVGDSLLAALRHFSGSDWTPEVEQTWVAAYTTAAEVMVAAADEAGAEPPWYDAEVVEHELRSAQIAVVTVRPRPALATVPGQSVWLETTRWPRVWRAYGVANARGADEPLEFHVRAVPGGLVSGTLVHHTGAGDTVKLGPPVQGLRFPEASDRPVLLAAGGTGLAPMKALLEACGPEAPPSRAGVELIFGVRRTEDLYELDTLKRLEATRPWLTVTTVVSDDPTYSGTRGTVADVLAARGSLDDPDAYVCGSTPMVSATRHSLEELGVSPERISVADYGIA